MVVTYKLAKGDQWWGTDENGILNEEFTFELKDDMAGMVFYLLPQEGYPTDVEDFYVRMTPWL